MAKGKGEIQQFEYRVRQTIDTIVVVEAQNIIEADYLVRSPDNWVDEQQVDMADFEIRGRA